MRLDIAGFRNDPLGFTLYAFPWGHPGPLQNHRPRKWFVRLCHRIKTKLDSNEGRDVWELVLEAVASGHGIGKSGGVAQLILWAMATQENTRGVVTANTDTQLRTKTWPELIKWHQMCVCRHWFEVTATAIYHKTHDKTWRCDAIPWSEHNTEAFAGLHNLGNRILLAMDEASGIKAPVWETAEGAMTDEKTQIIWLAMGNPTRSQGRFRECFTRFAHRWGHHNVDSRSVEGTNKALFDKWARDYGVNSQFFKVRVKGEFVTADADQLIVLDWLYQARERAATWDFVNGDGSRAKLRVSVDVASGGEDFTVITVAKHYASMVVVLKQKQFSFDPGMGAVESADAAEAMFGGFGGRKGEDDIVVDVIGVGDGCGGTLIKRRHSVILFKGGAESANPKAWRNRRVQAAIVARNALRDGLVIFAPACWDDELDWEDFCAQTCSIKTKPGTEKLEDLMTKEEMRRDGLKSPDRTESLFMQYSTSAPRIGVLNPGTSTGDRAVLIESERWSGFAQA